MLFIHHHAALKIIIKAMKHRNEILGKENKII